MDLSIGGDEPVSNPSPDQIEAGLASLTGDGDSFAILSESEMTYIQTSGSPTGGFVLEYQIDSLDQHFRSVSNELPLRTVTEAFTLYASGDERWRETTTWKREALAMTASRPPALAILAAVAVVAAALWWFAA